MIDIHFFDYKKPITTTAGFEYIDYQGGQFYQELSSFLKEICDPATKVFDWNKVNRHELQEIIKKYTHLSTEVVIWNIDNFGMEAGFISPGNVLNTQNIEKYIDTQESNVAKFFKLFKANVVTGWCDLKTGKVEGDFKDIPFELYLPTKIYYQPIKNVDVYDMAAAAIMHECGHAFFALHSVASSVLEDIFFTKTAAEISKAKNLQEKITIVNDFKTETGIDVSDEVKETGEVTLVGFRKGLAERDYNRALSIGATSINREILANAYAVRMGAGLTVAANFMSYTKQYQRQDKFALAQLGAFAALSVSGVAPFWTLALFTFRFISLASAHASRLVNKTHETLYRTVKSILRDMIDLLRDARKNDNVKIVAELTRDALAVEALADKMKPFLEDTVFQRFVQRAIKGSREASRENIEHFTSELNYNPLSIHANLTNGG